jgi:TonB family protein
VFHGTGLPGLLKEFDLPGIARALGRIQIDRVRYGWAIALSLLASTGYADVDLFPKKALEKEARSDTVEVPADSAWRSVERKAFGLFAPKLRAVTDETPPQILARQIARRRSQTSAPPDRTNGASDDSRATQKDPRLFGESREQQVDAAQAAYEEPVEWRSVEIEVTVDDKGNVLGARILHGSGRPTLDEAALTAVRRASNSIDGLGAHGPTKARLRVEAGVTVDMPARTITYDPGVRPKGAIIPIAKGRFGSGRKTEVNAVLQPHVRTRITITDLSAVAPAR